MAEERKKIKNETGKGSQYGGYLLNEGRTGGCLIERLAILIRRRASCGRLVQVVSECVKVLATQTEPEKVTNSEKVTDMVGTFLTDDSNGFQIIKIKNNFLVPNPHSQT